MIWEVDDDCDRAVSWAEFQAMFTRCRNDKTGARPDRASAPAAAAPSAPRPAARAGFEPRRLYNVVEFLMNDKDDSGAVSVEEVMGILYLRYGRQLLDSARAHLVVPIGPTWSRLHRLVAGPPAVGARSAAASFGRAG
jgi:calmodulin